jgi:hypothetical protein
VRIVALPFARPMRCAAIPYIGQSAKGEIWFDTGSELMGPDDHVYLSGTAVKECARMIGWVPPSDVRTLQAEVRHLNDELAALVAHRDDLERKLAAIDVIESADFRARKKPGRPPKEAIPSE